MAVYCRGGVAKAAPSIGHERLRELIDHKDPQAARFLVRLWDKQKSDITYAELRQLILTGQLDAATIERWQQDYSRFVTDELMPLWREMIDGAVAAFRERWPAWAFDVGTEQIAAYTARHAAELVTNSTGQQVEAIRAMVQRAATVQDITVDQLARIIRPVIGLYKGQAVANLNYYNNVHRTLIQNHPRMKAAAIDQRALDAAIKYAGKQHRYRAHMIAQTELAFGYNNGEYNAVRQAQAQGYLGRMQKRPSTAGDDRVCALCKALERETVDIDAPFSNGMQFAPWHPRCRCAMDYIEI